MMAGTGDTADLYLSTYSHGDIKYSSTCSIINWVLDITARLVNLSTEIVRCREIVLILFYSFQLSMDKKGLILLFQ